MLQTARHIKRLVVVAQMVVTWVANAYVGIDRPSAHHQFGRSRLMNWLHGARQAGDISETVCAHRCRTASAPTLALAMPLLKSGFDTVNESHQTVVSWFKPDFKSAKGFHRGFLAFSPSVGNYVLRSRGTEARAHFATRARWSNATIAAAIVFCTHASAQPPSAADFSTNVFGEALIAGQASTPVSERSPQFGRVLKALQARSGSSEPVLIVVERVTAFAQQPNCGRVRFALAQPGAKVVFAAIAGQMNVCRDGRPPLRRCATRPNVLVPFDGACPDGKAPVDTDEVVSAIRAATAAGGITQDQMLRQWAKQLATHASAAASAPSTWFNQPSRVTK